MMATELNDFIEKGKSMKHELTMAEIAKFQQE